jgi:multidrug efflux pump subunit AcrB
MNTLIVWFARNRVAANLLMGIIVLSGLFVMLTMVPVESSPQYERSRLFVKFSYPGGTPEDIEKSVVTRIEEAIFDLPGITELRSTAAEGSGSVTMQTADGYEYREVMTDIQSRVDIIHSFPDELEDLEVGVMSRRFEVISISVSGDLPEMELRQVGQRVRDEIAGLPGVTQVDITGIRPFQISIEASEQQLREYDLSFADLANAIRRSSIDLPAGAIQAGDQEFLVRTKGQLYNGADFADIVLKTRTDGSRLRLGDFAVIKDGFVDLPILSRFNGKSSVMIEVYRLGDQDALEISKQVKNYLIQAQDNMPPGVEIDYWRDRSKYIDNRISSLIQTAAQGAILVFIVLTLFLRLELAFWVVLGIPVSIIGAFAFMPIFDVTINYTSMFAFILVLGIVVDDAIVTGENIYKHMEKDKDPTDAVIQGTQEVAIAVTFGVLTTIVAFASLLTMEGSRSKMFTMIPAIVIPVLLLSLIETKLILPSHLKHMRNELSFPWLNKIQGRVSDYLSHFINNIYQPLLLKTLKNPGLTLAIFFSVLLIIASTIFSGWIRFTFFPRVQSEIARAQLTLPEGTPYEVTRRHVERIEQAAIALREKYNNQIPGETIITNIYSTVSIQGSVRMGLKPNQGYVNFEVIPQEMRTNPISSTALAKEWRRKVGEIAGAKKLVFKASLFRPANPIDIMLKGHDFDELNQVSAKIKKQLSKYPGVFDVGDDFSQGKEQVQLQIKPEAELLGISSMDLGLQVRGAFHGMEVQRMQRNGEEVKVYVRYPASERQSFANLESMKIRTPDGSEVPIREVADISITRAPAVIHRSERYRTIHVTADADQKTVQLPILRQEMDKYINEILIDHPDVSFVEEGEAKETRASFKSLGLGLILVLFIIYTLLAVPFQSYSQPFIVMSVIPFGLIGAVLGHILLGLDLTIQSVLGMLALTGVVVNDSLVLVDYINRSRQSGVELFEAVVQAGNARFRAIFLTSITTFIGLMPMMASSNTQAQFLIPMAVSLAFGVLFATFITLFLVPSFYLLLENMKIQGNSNTLKTTG